MKKLKIILYINILLFFTIIGVYLGIYFTINNLEIDGVNEVDNGIITIKFMDNYYDYEYKYNEIIKGE